MCIYRVLICNNRPLIFAILNILSSERGYSMQENNRWAYEHKAKPWLSFSGHADKLLGEVLLRSQTSNTVMPHPPN